MKSLDKRNDGVTLENFDEHFSMKQIKQLVMKSLQFFFITNCNL